MDEAEAFRPPAFHDGGDQQPVQEALFASGAAQVDQGVYVGILAVGHQLQPPLFHQRIDLLKMLQFLLGQFDQGRQDAGAVGILDHEAHGQSRGLALRVGVVDQELVEIFENVVRPLGIGGGGEIEGYLAHGPAVVRSCHNRNGQPGQRSLLGNTVRSSGIPWVNGMFHITFAGKIRAGNILMQGWQFQARIIHEEILLRKSTSPLSGSARPAPTPAGRTPTPGVGAGGGDSLPRRAGPLAYAGGSAQLRSAGVRPS